MHMSGKLDRPQGGTELTQDPRPRPRHATGPVTLPGHWRSPPLSPSGWESLVMGTAVPTSLPGTLWGNAGPSSLPTLPWRCSEAPEAPGMFPAPAPASTSRPPETVPTSPKEPTLPRSQPRGP